MEKRVGIAARDPDQAAAASLRRHVVHTARDEVPAVVYEILEVLGFSRGGAAGAVEENGFERSVGGAVGVAHHNVAVSFRDVVRAVERLVALARQQSVAA